MKKQILLAYDDAQVREMLRNVLEADLYDVVPITNGGKPVAESGAETPALVLLDLDLPDGDRRKALNLLGQTPSFVPVIAVAATPQQYEYTAELGIDALIEKPLNPPRLRATITSLLAESGTKRE